MRTTKILITLRMCAGWFESSLCEHVKGYVFLRCGSLYISRFPITLRKHAYSNILKIHHQSWKFSDKKSDIFHISAGAVLTSTHNLCFWAEIRKNNVYPCKPQFYYIKVGFKGLPQENKKDWKYFKMSPVDCLRIMLRVTFIIINFENRKKNHLPILIFWVSSRKTKQWQKLNAANYFNYSLVAFFIHELP